MSISMSCLSCAWTVPSRYILLQASDLYVNPSWECKKEVSLLSFFPTNGSLTRVVAKRVCLQIQGPLSSDVCPREQRRCQKLQLHPGKFLIVSARVLGCPSPSVSQCVQNPNCKGCMHDVQAKILVQGCPHQSKFTQYRIIRPVDAKLA